MSFCLCPEQLPDVLSALEQSAQKISIYRESRPKAQDVKFDEMESFIHTKLKPVAIPIAVKKDTRKVLAIGIEDIGAKGHLKAIAIKNMAK